MTLQYSPLISTVIRYSHSQTPKTNYLDGMDYLVGLRVLFYALVLLRVFMFAMNPRKKINIKERIYRKYVFSFGEQIRSYGEAENFQMQTVLANTIKNASEELTLPPKRIKDQEKKVSFQQADNQYFDPVVYKDESEEERKAEIATHFAELINKSAKRYQTVQENKQKEFKEIYNQGKAQDGALPAEKVHIIQKTETENIYLGSNQQKPIEKEEAVSKQMSSQQQLKKTEEQESKTNYQLSEFQKNQDDPEKQQFLEPIDPSSPHLLGLSSQS